MKQLLFMSSEVLMVVKMLMVGFTLKVPPKLWYPPGITTQKTTINSFSLFVFRFKNTLPLLKDA
jgi:hypothetical protein